MNMSGVSGGSGMAGMSGCSGSQHSKMAGGKSSTADANEKGNEAAKIGQPVNLDANVGGKVDISA